MQRQTKNNIPSLLPTIYCDLDETLVDWFTGADKVLLQYGFPKWRDTYWNQYTDQWSQELRWAILNKDHEFWLHLNFLPDGEQLWKFIVPYSPHILSHAVKYSTRAVSQKRQWVATNLGLNNDAQIHLVLNRSDKSRFAINNGRSNILIDDHEKNCIDFRTAGGIAIKHTSATNTILELRKLGFK